MSNNNVFVHRVVITCNLCSRRLTEILRRGRRTLRKSLTRKSQSQEEDSTPSVSHSSSLEATSSPLDKVTIVINAVMINIITILIMLLF